MRRRLFSILFFHLPAAGCAVAPPPPPLALDHPANPDATQAPIPPAPGFHESAEPAPGVEKGR